MSQRDKHSGAVTTELGAVGISDGITHPKTTPQRARRRLAQGFVPIAIGSLFHPNVQAMLGIELDTSKYRGTAELSIGRLTPVAFGSDLVPCAGVTFDISD